MRGGGGLEGEVVGGGGGRVCVGKYLCLRARSCPSWSLKQLSAD